MRVLLVLIVAGMVACGSADNDPANVVEKPAQVAPQEK